MCLQGASAVQSVLEEIQDPRIRVFAVWEPVLYTDWTAPTTSVLSRLHDRRAAQYWDRRLLLSRKIKEAVASEPAHGLGAVAAQSKVVWDVVMIYPKGIRWEGTFPSPAFADGPVVSVIDSFRQQLRRMTNDE